jgi:hypothetical protein
MWGVELILYQKVGNFRPPKVGKIKPAMTKVNTLNGNWPKSDDKVYSNYAPKLEYLKEKWLSLTSCG